MWRKPMKQVPVLIAGGGPVGMTLAKTLASFGIECMLVEKNPSTTRHPKMDITNSRSMELFRKLGLLKNLRDVAVPETNNFDVSWITSLSGHELHRFRYPSVEQARAIIRERNDGSQPVEPPMRVSQVAIEPVLKRAIDAEPKVDVRFGVAFEDFAQGADSVIATVRNIESGQTEKIKCQYLVGCDGGVSQVRNCLDIRYDGIARDAQLYMVHFRSDARDVLQPWGVAWHYQTSQETMIAQNDRAIWTLHTFLPPDTQTQHVEGVVRIGAPDDFGNLFLAKHIGELQGLHPGLKIELITLPYTLSVSKREADISIGVERPAEGRLFVRRLTDFEMRLYATRGYIDAHGPIDQPSDLSRQTWIGPVSDFNATTLMDAAIELDCTPTLRFACSSFAGQLAAAINGAGVAMLPRYVADQERSLAPVLPDIVKTIRAYHMVVHADLRDLPRVRAVTNYIGQKVAEARALFVPSSIRSNQSKTPSLPAWLAPEALTSGAGQGCESAP